MLAASTRPSRRTCLLFLALIARCPISAWILRLLRSCFDRQAPRREPIAMKTFLTPRRRFGSRHGSPHRLGRCDRFTGDPRPRHYDVAGSCRERAMRIAVMGAGAVGCYYGGMLARAGHAVTLIGRARHVDALRRAGLLLGTQSFRAHVPVQASTEASAVRGATLVLCCVKSTDTEAAAADLAAHLEPDALVLSLQNGVDNAERLQALLRQRVAPAVVYVAAEMAGPGHVRPHGRGELVIGPIARGAGT